LERERDLGKGEGKKMKTPAEKVEIHDSKGNGGYGITKEVE
jgi:hypothetical protein